MSQSSILIIDDDVNFNKTVESLVLRLGHKCCSAFSLEEGTEILEKTEIDLVFLDVNLPDGNGINFIDTIKASHSSPEVIILTGQGDPDGAEIAIQKGVWDYLVKPSSLTKTQLSLTRALSYRKEKKNEIKPVILITDDIIGKSDVIKPCLNMVALASQKDTNVLLTGNTGTGKELFAKAIHDNSKRADNNFTIVDCTTLTETLIESTLFGHKKGAFTGAESDRTGLVKLADNGTLFLDEIGELPLSLQKTFLRVLQEKKFRPVGDIKEYKSDFRLIAATNRDLDTMVKNNKFRQDLLFRLKSVTIHLPDLKDRMEDIEPLAIYFINNLCDQYSIPYKGIDTELLNTLKRYQWPGNIRELYNVLERAFIDSGSKEMIYAINLPEKIRINAAKNALSKNSESRYNESLQDYKAINSIDKISQNKLIFTNMSFKEFKAITEKKYLENIIDITDNKISEILKITKLSRSHYYSLLKKYQVKN